MRLIVESPRFRAINDPIQAGPPAESKKKDETEKREDDWVEQAIDRRLCANSKSIHTRRLRRQAVYHKDPSSSSDLQIVLIFEEKWVIFRKNGEFPPLQERI